MMHKKEVIEWIENHHKGTVFEALGIEIQSYEPNVVVALNVDKRHLQHAGIVHGGIYVLLAESAASIAAALCVDPQEVFVAGMEVNANHLIQRLKLRIKHILKRN